MKKINFFWDTWYITQIRETVQLSLPLLHRGSANISLYALAMLYYTAWFSPSAQDCFAAQIWQLRTDTYDCTWNVCTPFTPAPGVRVGFPTSPPLLCTSWEGLGGVPFGTGPQGRREGARKSQTSDKEELGEYRTESTYYLLLHCLLRYVK